MYFNFKTLKKNLAVAAVAGILLSSCSEPTSSQEQEVVVEEVSAFEPALESQVDSLLALMTLEEKVLMMHGTAKFFSGGVERLGIPELAHTDGPLGVREEIERNSWNAAGWDTDSATYFPAGGALAATWNLNLSKRYGEAIGAETRARDKDFLLTPAINIQRSPLGGRNYEYFSEDPYLIAQMVVPYIKGVQSNDVAACVKHYAVNNQETNRETVSTYADERTLREIYLPGFKAAIEEGGAYSIMGAYNRYRGTYLCENDYMLNKILKGEWGFKGVVISDWNATHSTVASAKNGLDIEMGTRIEDYNQWYFAQPLIDSVKTGTLDESVVDEHVRRILRVALNMKKTDASRQKGAINTKEHRQVNYDVASEAVVLLKNSGDLLPLDISTVKSIAVIGDNATQIHAQGGFGAGVKAKYEITPLQGLKNKLGDDITINYAEGCKEKYLHWEGIEWFEKVPDNIPEPALIAGAVEAAKASEVAVIFAGSNRLVESEATDRKSMELPFNQVALIKAVVAANPKTIVVMISGTPFDLTEVKEVAPAIVWGWFNGSESGNVIADVLFGDINPSGKLPFTIPKKLEDSPAHATKSFPGTPDSVEYKEGILVGYRWFDTKNIEPLYPFGYGLSYSQFEYSAVTVEEKTYKASDVVNVSVTLKNTSSVAGKEIIQVYANDVESSLIRPAKELKAFTKVSLKAGEKKTVTIPVKVADLAFFDDTQMKWVVEPGTFKLIVGASSRDIKGETSITVQ